MMHPLITRIFNSKLIRNSGIYLLSSLLNSIVPFVLIPILTRHLSPADYGVLAMYSALVGFSGPIVGLTVHGSTGVKFFDKETDLAQYIGNCIMLLALGTFVASSVVWFFADRISEFAAFPKPWLWAVVVVSAGQTLISLLLTVWQSSSRPINYSIFQNSQALALFFLTILLVVGLGENWEGSILAQVFATGFFAIAAYLLLSKNGYLRFQFDKSYFSQAFKFGVLLIPHELGAVAMAWTDRLFITNMIGIQDSGIFTIGYQVASIILLMASSFNLAYVPWLFSQLSENSDAGKRKIVKFTYQYFILICLAAFGLTLISPWFLTWFVGNEFIHAQKYIAWLSFGFAFKGMYFMVANYIFYTMRTAVIAWITLFTALCNIGLNYILIKTNGPVGAAQASALALFLGFVFTWIASARVYAMPWRLRG